MEINGLPLHPLVVHAAVVFGPLAALVGARLRRGADVARPAALADAGRWSLIATASIWAAYLTGDNFLRQQPSFDQRRSSATRSSTHQDAAPAMLRWMTTALRASSRVARGRGCTHRDRARSAVVLERACSCVGGGRARSCWTRPHRRRRRPGRLGLSLVRAGSLRAVSSRRNDATRSGSAWPSATASSSPHSGSSVPWVQPRGQSSVISSRSGNASIRSLRLHVREPERADAGGVDDPAARRPGSASMYADVEVCRPRPVTALTMPTSRSAVGHQRVDQRRLADAAGAEQHADPAVAAARAARTGRRRAG